MCVLFFFNDTATTEIYTLSLHDALPISFDVNPQAISHKYSPSQSNADSDHRFWHLCLNILAQGL